MEQFTQFVIHHWELWLALGIIVCVLLGMELRNRMQGIQQLSPQQATDLINRADAIVIDVREAASFAAGHIVGAVSVPMSSLAERLAQLSVHQDKPVIVACNVGQSSASAAVLLRQQGFSNVNNLSGGMTAWRAAGLPVVKA